MRCKVATSAPIIAVHSRTSSVCRSFRWADLPFPAPGPSSRLLASRSADSRIGVRGVLISWAIRRPTSLQAARRSASINSVRTSMTITAALIERGVDQLQLGGRLFKAAAVLGQLGGHFIERERERGQFVVPDDAGAISQIAALDPFGRLNQLLDGIGD